MRSQSRPNDIYLVAVLVCGKQSAIIDVRCSRDPGGVRPAVTTFPKPMIDERKQRRVRPGRIQWSNQSGVSSLCVVHFWRRLIGYFSFSLTSWMEDCRAELTEL